MGFGGVATMNAVIKNNRNLLSNPRREKFKKSIGSYPKIINLEFGLKTASPRVLRAIKTRLLHERKSRQRKVIIVFSFIVISIISFLLYFLNSNTNSLTL